MNKNKNRLLLSIIFIFSILTGFAVSSDLYLSAFLCSSFGLIAILYYKGEPNTVNIFNRII